MVGLARSGPPLSFAGEEETNVNLVEMIGKGEVAWVNARDAPAPAQEPRQMLQLDPSFRHQSNFGFGLQARAPTLATAGLMMLLLS